MTKPEKAIIDSIKTKCIQVNNKHLSKQEILSCIKENTKHNPTKVFDLMHKQKLIRYVRNEYKYKLARSLMDDFIVRDEKNYEEISIYLNYNADEILEKLTKVLAYQDRITVAKFFNTYYADINIVRNTDKCCSRDLFPDIEPEDVDVQHFRIWLYKLYVTCYKFSSVYKKLSKADKESAIMMTNRSVKKDGYYILFDVTTRTYIIEKGVYDHHLTLEHIRYFDTLEAAEKFQQTLINHCSSNNNQYDDKEYLEWHYSTPTIIKATEIDIAKVAISCTHLLPIELEKEDDGYTIDEDNKNNFEINNKILISYKGNDKTVIVPDGIMSIGEKAFSYCENLFNIQLPDSLTSIEDGAFSGCNNLTNIQLPDSLTLIGNWAFSSCSNLISIKIPDSVTSIGYGAFYGCSNLASIKIPNSITEIGYMAFENCIKLFCIRIPNSITEIGHNAFENCNNLIIYGYTNSYIQQYAKHNKIPFVIAKNEKNKFKNKFIIDNGKLKYYNGNDETVVVPDGIKSIETHAFFHKNLTSIQLPDSLTSIEDGAFYGCSNLTSIKIPDNLTYIGDEAFSCCSNLINIKFPDNLTSIGKKAFKDCKKLTSIQFSDIQSLNPFVSIGDEAFSCCSNLINIKFPDNLTDIGEKAFKDCKKLISIQLPDNCFRFMSIENNAFLGCSNLTIYGYANSYAQEYAKKEKIPFIVVESPVYELQV